MVVLIQDEVHLCWGDTLGYVWGQRNKRIEVPILNERQRQTYYGSIDLVSAELYLKAYPRGNSTYTVEYLRYLMDCHPDTRLLLIWDKASYHTSTEVRDFLAQVNGDVPEEERKIQIELLPTASPQLNPIEDVWLKGKTFLRRKGMELDTFV